jgi:hypothetical protein
MKIKQVTKTRAVVSTVSRKQCREVRRQLKYIFEKVWLIHRFFSGKSRWLSPTVFKKSEHTNFSAYDLYVQIDRQLKSKGWSWDNYGSCAKDQGNRWAIDHIKPIPAFTTKTYTKANDITNLQVELESVNASKNSIYNGKRYVYNK